MVSNFTLDAEKISEKYTGIPIDSNLTSSELALSSQFLRFEDPNLINNVSNLNKEAIQATKLGIDFKTKLLENVNACEVFSFLYPLQIEHVRREAIYFYNLLNRLETQRFDGAINEKIGIDLFWDDIMSEHGKFIRGLLDPKQEILIQRANDFSIKYDKLKMETQLLNNINMLNKITYDSIQLTKEFINFKENATLGSIQCQIKSIMLPLLADHVLREAYYYLSLLEGFTS